MRLVLRAAQSGSCAHGRWACGLHAVRCVVGVGRGACGFFKRRLSPQIVSNIKQASFAGFAVAYASALACAYVSAGIIRGRHGEFSHAPESRRWLHTQASMCARKQACALDPGPGDPPRRCCPSTADSSRARAPGRVWDCCRAGAAHGASPTQKHIMTYQLYPKCLVSPPLLPVHASAAAQKNSYRYSCSGKYVAHTISLSPSLSLSLSLCLTLSLPLSVSLSLPPSLPLSLPLSLSPPPHLSPPPLTLSRVQVARA